MATTTELPTPRDLVGPNTWGQQFPHPPGRVRLLGDVRSIKIDGPVLSMLDWPEDVWPLVQFQAFRQRFVFAGSAEITAELCDETRFEKVLTPGVAALRVFAGDGLFTAATDEPNWRLAHDLLMPAFTKSAMKNYHPLMLDAISELFTSWERRGDVIDVAPDMTRLTLETISRAAFGEDLGSFERDTPHAFVSAMIAALKTGQRTGGLSGLPGAKALTALMTRANARHQRYIDTMLEELVAGRRRRGDGGETDLLAIMLSQNAARKRDVLDDRNIGYQILTFLVAGHETTSGALSFALYHLSQDRELLARAHAEVDSILEADAEPAFEQVAKFRLLRRIIDESLRLWPTAPGFSRGPIEPTTVAGRYEMAPGDWAIVHLPKLHRDPAVWTEPSRFDPDRFLAAEVKKRPAHSYKPFGTGERACIGRQFALHESVLLLARLLQRYDFESADPGYELAITERLTLMPSGLRLRIRRR
ncbi:cytochrome P450 [Gordonia rubripertincta]|uniref:Cytochrome P450 n=1 Tax=Gordonia rubripertincta TaxID=36822 RepID=A0ABT4MYC6_GORRU|nr:cytochrome P450 [Gordonia rubripertincta]MCZ4552008.1 cytochrome P450 [Gordonia rubripertincta]